MSQSTEDLTEQWQQEAAIASQHLAAPGVAGLEALRGLSGMEIFEAILAGRLPSVPIGHLMGFSPVIAEPGRMVFQGTPGPEHYNPIGSVHGGYIATLLDSAVGCAVHSLLPAGKGFTTLELKINMLRALTVNTGPVRAEGTIIHLRRQTGVAEGRLTDARGKLLAWASTTYLIFDLPD